MVPAPVRRTRVVRTLLALALGIAVAAPARAAEPATHAMWIPASALEGPDAVRRAINGAVAAGVEAIVAAAPLYPEAGPDRFADLLRQAREHQLRVFASIDIDRVALPGEVPASRDHVLYQHPDWLMVPRALAPEVLPLDVRSPEYVGRLARWTRSNGVDGVYLSPVLDDAAAFVVSAAASVLKRYAVDGVQLDAARYPGDDFDYGRRAVDAFRHEIRPTLTAAERTQVDADETIDPFAYPNAFPDAWRRYRQSRVTSLVSRVGTALRDVRPGAVVVAAVSGTAETDLEDHFQDWRAWLADHLIDAVSVRSGSVATIVSDTTLLATIIQAGPASGSR
jgi:uncharacterized lipoprotein YddW (UPF0748 family)